LLACLDPHFNARLGVIIHDPAAKVVVTDFITEPLDHERRILATW